jgi:hypothetical protein
MVLSTLDAVAGDIEAAQDMEMPYPDHVVTRLDEHEGLLAAMKLARELLSPEDLEKVKTAFRDARDSHFEPDHRPEVPLLPETELRLNETLEVVRRARILDSELDYAIRQEAA